LLLEKHSKSFCFDSRHPEATPAFDDHRYEIESPLVPQHLLSQLGSDPNKSQLSDGEQVSQVIPSLLQQHPFYDDESLRDGPPKQFESEPMDGPLETLRSEYHKRKMLNSSKAFGDNFEGLKSKIDSKILMSLQRSLEPGQVRLRQSLVQPAIEKVQPLEPKALGSGEVDGLASLSKSNLLESRTGNYELDFFKDSFKKKLASESDKSYFALERPKTNRKTKESGKQSVPPEMKESKMTQIDSELVGLSEANTCDCSCQRSQIRININGKPVALPEPAETVPQAKQKKRALEPSFRKAKGAAGLELKDSKVPFSHKY
jgi:hypothetical protein